MLKTWAIADQKGHAHFSDEAGLVHLYLAHARSSLFFGSGCRKPPPKGAGGFN